MLRQSIFEQSSAARLASISTTRFPKLGGKDRPPWVQQLVSDHYSAILWLSRVLSVPVLTLRRVMTEPRKR